MCIRDRFNTMRELIELNKEEVSQVSGALWGVGGGVASGAIVNVLSDAEDAATTDE